MTGLLFWVTLKPAALSWLIAPCAVSPVTSGTWAVVGALATTRLIVDPAATLVLPAGFWSTTLPSGALVVVWLVVATTKPALLSCDRADDTDSPITLGTVTIGLPEEM